MSAAKDVTQITDLIKGALERQMAYGIDQFKSSKLYGTPEAPNPKLNLENLSGVSVKNQDVAEMLNKTAKEIGTNNAQDAIKLFASVDQALAAKLDNAVEVNDKCCF